MQEVIPRRIVVYAKDVMNITGRKERAARKLLADIRRKYKKRKGDFVSIKDFSNFTGLDENTIAPFLV